MSVPIGRQVGALFRVAQCQGGIITCRDQMLHRPLTDQSCITSVKAIMSYNGHYFFTSNAYTISGTEPLNTTAKRIDQYLIHFFLSFLLAFPLPRFLQHYCSRFLSILSDRQVSETDIITPTRFLIGQQIFLQQICRLRKSRLFLHIPTTA